MREFFISGHDTIPESSLSGEPLEYAIPGSVDDVWDWLQNEIRGGYGIYNFYTIGDSLLLYREKQVVIIFNDFKRVTNNRSTFRVMFHPGHKYNSFLVLSRLAVSFGADWAQDVKEILAKTPPSSYHEWIERPGAFPGSTERILAWHEGPPPGWEPQAIVAARQDETAQDDRKRGKPGRKKHLDDVWAWEQVNIHKHSMNDVYSAWEKREGVINRTLADPKRQFNRITKPEWGQKTK